MCICCLNNLSSKLSVQLTPNLLHNESFCLHLQQHSYFFVLPGTVNVRRGSDGTASQLPLLVFRGRSAAARWGYLRRRNNDDILVPVVVQHRGVQLLNFYRNQGWHGGVVVVLPRVVVVFVRACVDNRSNGQPQAKIERTRGTIKTTITVIHVYTVYCVCFVLFCFLATSHVSRLHQTT